MMATNTDASTTFCGRLRGGFSFALTAAAALYALAPTPAQESPKGKPVRPPPIVRPPVLRPPHTGVDGAHGYVAPLAEERARARWAKRLEGMGDGLPKYDKKTGKYGFNGTDHTFYSGDSAREAWEVMMGVYEHLQEGDVKGAKKIWKKAKKHAETFWHGRSWGKPRRDIHYGDGKDAKAQGDADETAQNDILDGLWHDVKSAEAAGLKPVKASAPAK